MKVTIEIFDWSLDKPKPGSRLMTWGFFEGPSIPDKFDLDEGERLTAGRVWVNDDDDSETLDFVPGQTAIDGYTLMYTLGDDIVLDDEEFLWAYAEDLEDIEFEG